MIVAVRLGYKIEGEKVIGPLGKPLKLDVHEGYPRFSISFQGERIKINVHRLKALSLYGEKILESGFEVRHLNHNRSDFADRNINFGTSSQNRLDNPEKERIRTAKIAASKIRRLTYDEAEKIRKLNQSGVSYKKLVEMYRVSKSTISYIVNNKTYVN